MPKMVLQAAVRVSVLDHEYSNIHEWWKVTEACKKIKLCSDASPRSEL